MKAPTCRSVNGQAIQTLVKEFNYPAITQDWQYETAQLSDIDKYFAKYHATNDDDIRFLLMEMILQTCEESRHSDWISNHWPTVKLLLQSNFHIHEYTVYYWCVFQNEDVEDCFYITGPMRTLWNGQSGKFLLSSSL